MKTKHETVRVLAAEICGHLQGNFTLETQKKNRENPLHAVLRLDGCEQGINLWLDTYRQRVHIATIAPQDPNDDRKQLFSDWIYNAITPEITVSPDRPAKSIARDIERRLLPGYLELWALAAERRDLAVADHNAKQALTADIRAALGDSALPKSKFDEGKIHVSQDGDDGASGTIRANSDTVYIDLYVTPAQAIAIASILRDLQH